MAKAVLHVGWAVPRELGGALFDRLELPAFLSGSNGLISCWWLWLEPAAHELYLDLGFRKNTFLFLRLFFFPHGFSSSYA